MPIPSISNGPNGSALRVQLEKIKFKDTAAQEKHYQLINKNNDKEIDEAEAEAYLQLMGVQNQCVIEAITPATHAQPLHGNNLESLGTVFEFKSKDGSIYEAVILKPANLRKLGINLEQIFYNAPAHKDFIVTPNGNLGGADFWGQVELLKEIIRKRPDLDFKLGFLGGLSQLSESELEDLEDAFSKVTDQKEIRGFWLGKPEGITSADKRMVITLQTLEEHLKPKDNKKFSSMYISRDSEIQIFHNAPETHDPSDVQRWTVVIFGAKKY
jgi:hypothetical protein